MLYIKKGAIFRANRQNKKRVKEHVRKQRKKKIAPFCFVLFVAADDVLAADMRTEGKNYY